MFLHLFPFFLVVFGEVVFVELLIGFGCDVISLFVPLVSGNKDVLGTNEVVFPELLIGFGCDGSVVDIVVVVELLIGLVCDVSVVDITTIAAITTPDPTVNIT